MTSRWLVRLPAALIGTCALVTSSLAQQPSAPVVTGKHVTAEDLNGATPVRTLSVQDFNSSLDAFTAKQCEKSTLHATSDGKTVQLGDSSFGIDELGAELLRRYHDKAFYCVDVVGPGGDFKRTRNLMRELKGTEIISINWRPQVGTEHN